MITYKLYLCTDSLNMEFDTLLKAVEEAIIGGVTCVQYREKFKDDVVFFKEAYKLKEITSKYGIPLIINDRVAVAKAIDSDGVHLGQNDISCVEARRILGYSKIIGVSVHNLKEALQAEKDGANYLGVGAMFSTHTKPDAERVSFNELKKICNNTSLPIVVIGGINLKTIECFKNYRIQGYAMISPILRNKNPQKAAKRLLKQINYNMK